MSLRIVVAGATGWTGSAVTRGVLAADDMELVGAVARESAGRDIGTELGLAPTGVDVSDSLNAALVQPVDVVIDYTSTASTKALTLESISRGVPVVLGTSGLTAPDFDDIDKMATARGVGVISGNFSLTAALMQHLSLIAAEHIPEFEVIDHSWADKEDVPSGTARELAERLGDVRQPERKRELDTLYGPAETRGASINGVQVHSLRMSGFTLRCAALFGLAGERLEIVHEAGQSADPYVYGTLIAARRIGSVTGVVRGLDQLLFGK